MNRERDERGRDCGEARAEELLPERQNPAPSSAQTEAEPFVAFRFAVVAVRSSVGLRVW